MAEILAVEHLRPMLACEAGDARSEPPPPLLDHCGLTSDLLEAPLDPEHPPGSLNAYSLFPFLFSVLFSLTSHRVWGLVRMSTHLLESSVVVRNEALVPLGTFRFQQ